MEFLNPSFLTMDEFEVEFLMNLNKNIRYSLIMLRSLNYKNHEIPKINS